MKPVYMLLAEGFEEIEALATLDILRRAGLTVETISIYEHRSVKGAHAIEVIADSNCTESLETPQLLILPGGTPGTDNLRQSPFVQKMICMANDADAYLAAICAAPSIYGELGLLTGRRSVCYPGYEQYLLGATVTNNNVEIDGRFITSRSAGTAFDFAFAIIEVLLSKEKVNDVRKQLTPQ